MKNDAIWLPLISVAALIFLLQAASSMNQEHADLCRAAAAMDEAAGRATDPAVRDLAYRKAEKFRQQAIWPCEDTAE